MIDFLFKRKINIIFFSFIKYCSTCKVAMGKNICLLTHDTILLLMCFL